MPAGTAILQLILKATDNASRVLDQSSGKVAAFSNTAGVAFGAAAGAVGAAGLASLKMAADFERSMAEVRTLLPDMNEEGFAELTQGVLRFSKEVGIATDEAVPALYQAISAGVPPDNVLDFMSVAAQASIGGVTELETAVDGITSVVNAYGSSVISAQEASDIMFTAVKLGKTDFSQLSGALFNVIPTAATLGVSFEEVAAQLAVITSQGVPTSVATTQLRQAFLEASKSGTQLDQAIQKIHGASFPELIKQGMTSTEILESVRHAAGDFGIVLGEDVVKFNDLFGSVEAMNAVLAVTGNNYDKVSAALDQTNASAGATETAFNVISDTVSFKMDKAINAVKVTMTEWGTQMLEFSPALTGIASGASLAGGAVSALSGLLPTAGSAFSAFGIAARVAWAAVLGPVGLVIAGIAAAIAVGVLIWKNWDTIKAKAIEIFGKIKDLFDSKLGWLLPGGILIKGILFLARNWREIWGGIRSFTVGVWNGISDTFRGGANFVIGIINRLIDVWNDLDFEIPEFKVGPATFGGFGFGLPDLSKIQTFARGGVVQGPTGSPQLVLAHAGERILSRRETAAAGPSVTVNINAPVYGIADLREVIETTVRDSIRRGGFAGVWT